MKILISLTVLYCCIYINSCVLKRNSSENIVAAGSKQSDIIDTLKWYYYVYNFMERAAFHDSISHNKIMLDPIECDIVFNGSKKKNEDSAYYFFSLYKPGYSFGYIETGGADGLAIFKGNITPFLTHVILESNNNPDSVKYFFSIANNNFIQYLKTYKGQMGEWLRFEAMRRNILQK